MRAFTETAFPHPRRIRMTLGWCNRALCRPARMLTWRGMSGTMHARSAVCHPVSNYA